MNIRYILEYCLVGVLTMMVMLFEDVTIKSMWIGSLVGFIIFRFYEKKFLKRKFKCPVCGEETIDIMDRKKLNYRYKSKLRCTNCNAKLRDSKLSILLIFSFGVLGFFFLIQDIGLCVKAVLMSILSMVYLYIDTYVIPIVEDED